MQVGTHKPHASLGRALPLDGGVAELHLSAELLTRALGAVTEGAEPLGGVERYLHAISLKSTMFKDALLEGKAQKIELDALMGLCVFMSSVRRRIAPYLDTNGLATIRKGFGILFDGLTDTTSVDARIAAFCKLFPQDRKHFFVRDLAAEVLHYANPELYPLMTRWVWDQQTNTGSLREIWFGEDVDNMVIHVADDYAAFLTLRQEISLFLQQQGIYRDVPFFVDLLLAQVYSHYICAQGGSYLRTDFASAQDPMQYTRRLLGLDGIEPRSGKTRLKSIDGSAFVLDENMKLLG